MKGTLSSRVTLATDASYRTRHSGTQYGCLSGPARADFDLYLAKLSGKRWVRVAGGYEAGSAESVSYKGTPGTYRWQVARFSGSGSYLLKISHPA
jgi:streptogrisin C